MGSVSLGYLIYLQPLLLELGVLLVRVGRGSLGYLYNLSSRVFTPNLVLRIERISILN